MGQTTIIANATLRTAGDWIMAEREGVIEKKVFRRWNEVLGRKTV